MIRAAALALIAVSCAGLGFVKSQALSGRVEDLLSLRKILRLLKGEISYAGTPLPEAFYRIGGKLEASYRDFLQDLSVDMQRYDGDSFAEIFARNTECHLKETRLSKDDREEWKQFGAMLGYLDKEMQLSTLKSFDETLAQKISELKEGLPAQKKLYQSLGVMGGLFLVIFLA